jgi:hypothetical protein
MFLAATAMGWRPFTAKHGAEKLQTFRINIMRQNKKPERNSRFNLNAFRAGVVGARAVAQDIRKSNRKRWLALCFAA